MVQLNDAFRNVYDEVENAIRITGGAAGGGSSDTKEATQLLVKAAVESIDSKVSTVTAQNSQTVLLSNIDGKLPALQSTIPSNTSQGVPVRAIGQDVTSCSFTNVSAVLNTPDLVERTKGTGVGATQAAGNLLVTTGTATNAEWLAKSVLSWQGSLILRYKTILSPTYC